MRNFKLHKRTKLLCIVNGDIKKQKKESNEEEREERRSCSDKLLWRLNKIQIRKCLRRKNERFGAQIKTHELGTVWLTHSSLSLLLFLLLFFFFILCSVPVQNIFFGWNGRNKPVQPDIWGSTNHSYFCTGLGSSAKNSGRPEFTPSLMMLLLGFLPCKTF